MWILEILLVGLCAGLSITSAATTTAASGASAPFSSSDQNVSLTATVNSKTGPVNQGAVTFTVLQGTTVIGSSVTSSVSNGQVKALYDLPGGTASGSYTIQATFNDGTNDFASSTDNTHTLTVGQPTTSIAASNATTTFSTGTQNVTLNATVTNSSASVNEGTVTFTVLQGNTVIGSPVTSGTVSNGQANVSYVLPSNTAAGSYTIEAVYNPGPDFTTCFDTSHTLTINNATTTTAASNATGTFSTGNQTLILTANVTSAVGPINQGTITFTVLQGSTVVGSAVTSGTVNSGQGSVSYSLPGGTVAGDYTIDAVYNAGPDFATSSDTSHTFSIGSASTSTTAGNASTNFSTSNQTVTLTANVTSGAGPVNEGTVTFTVLNGNTVIGSAVASGTLSNGHASVSYALPANTAVGNYTIQAVYNAGTDYLGSTDTSHTLSIGQNASSTTASNVSITAGAGGQNVTLTAEVSSSAGPIHDGTVTFTLLSGSTVIGSPVTSGTISNGQASAVYVLPAGVQPGSYTIKATYQDLTDNFADSTGTASLVVNSPPPSGGGSPPSSAGNPVSAGFAGLAIEEFELTLASVVDFIETAMGIPHESLDAALAQLSAEIAKDPLLSTPEGQIAMSLGQSAAFNALHGL